MLNFNRFLIAFSAVLVLAFLFGFSIGSILFLISIGFLVTAIGSMTMKWNFHLRAFTKAKHISEKKIAITFDDGPNAKYTPIVLRILEKYNAKATFFCIGKNIEANPEILKDTIQKGHQVSNHTYSHSFSFGFFKKEKFIEEIEKTDSLLDAATGMKNRYFRPPFGVTTPPLAKAIKITGHKVIGWNIRPYDTVFKNREKNLKHIIKKIFPGSIILLHDTHDRIPYVLEHLLQYLEKHNYRCVTVAELL